MQLYADFDERWFSDRGVARRCGLARGYGADAFLVGTHFMRQPDPGRALAARCRSASSVECAGRCSTARARARRRRARIVSAVREAVGSEVALAMDANCAYDPATAIESGRRCMPYDLLWYEEPISPLDVAGYGTIKQALPTCRLAGAEGLAGSFTFRDLIQARVLDVVQPDISIAGGFTEMRRIAAMANADYVRVIPHMWGGNVRLAATLHYQATMPDLPKQSMIPFPCYCEYDMTENGLRTELGTQFPMKDGWVDIPEGPGLGVEVNREVLEQYSK